MIDRRICLYFNVYINWVLIYSSSCRSVFLCTVKQNHVLQVTLVTDAPAVRPPPSSNPFLDPAPQYPSFHANRPAWLWLHVVYTQYGLCVLTNVYCAFRLWTVKTIFWLMSMISFSLHFVVTWLPLILESPRVGISKPACSWKSRKSHGI